MISKLYCEIFTPLTRQLDVKPRFLLGVRKEIEKDNSRRFITFFIALYFITYYGRKISKCGYISLAKFAERLTAIAEHR
jgi:hypothetical protein